MIKKFWKPAAVGSVLLVALAAQGGIPSPAVALPTDKTEEAPSITINETSDGFALSGVEPADQSGLRSLPTAPSGERITVSKLDNGWPVVLNEQFSLPSKIDPELAYEEAVREAAKEKELDILPDGESAAREGTFSSDDYPAPAEDFKPRIAFAVTPTSAAFKLNHSKGYDADINRSHALYVNGQLIAEHDSDEFSLDDLAPETEYQVRIVSSELDPTASGEDAGLSTSRMMSIATPSQTYDEAVQQVSAAAAAQQPTGQSYLHTTFIEDKYVDPGYAAAQGCGANAINVPVIWFGGDNRGYGVPAAHAPSTMPSFRSYAHVSMNYMSSESTLMTYGVDVGDTHRFKIYPDHTTSETRRASSKGIVITPTSITRQYGQAVVNHTVANPFCVAGAITYHDEVRFYRSSNTVEINGWRFPVPNHEISASTGTTYAPGIYWLPAYWGPTASFNCLLGTCTRDNYSLNQVGVNP